MRRVQREAADLKMDRLAALAAAEQNSTDQEP
jgi:hypothetical protein